jgi:competence protein ComEA
MPSGGKVDINSATAEEFDRVAELKGHGFEIVRYREERGSFTDLRQLDEVPGLTGKVSPEHSQLAVGSK